ncbi:shikimate kinase [bacterium]|nr:shikimate kinase [bacterium]
MKNNIILIGMMGAGKTFIGKALKNALPVMNLVDIDEYIEQQQQIKISEIFEKFGENYFRELETIAIREIIQRENQIISLGGGAFERKENRKLLNSNGYTIYLKAPAHILFDRIKNETHRPLLQQGFGVEKVSQILSAREHNYKKALITVDTAQKSQYNIIEEVMKRIEEYAEQD